MSAFTRLRLENFTVFTEFDQEFSPGLNVFIGKNGTGKTHLLKLLYTSAAITIGRDRELGFTVKLCNTFSPHQMDVSRLIRQQRNMVNSSIQIYRDLDLGIEAIISEDKLTLNQYHSDKGKEWNELNKWTDVPMEPVFIPVKEMLSHAPGFLALFERRDLRFEDVYADIIRKAYIPALREPLMKEHLDKLQMLEEIMSGRIVQKDEAFFLDGRQGDIEFPLLSEGMRKLGLIWILIRNGSISRDSVLFWDEPEANLNPELIRSVVHLMLMFQRQGTQIFISTHNYIVLKEIDLLANHDDQIKFFSLYKGEDGDISCHTASNFLSLQHNAITEKFDDLYDREIIRQFGRPTQ
ncbi:MAG: ATP-binding protein [Alphaproteobacteria bacterium]|nr:ATP-binding protein [Alphaproteobacteria bacterium]